MNYHIDRDVSNPGKTLWSLGLGQIAGERLTIEVSVCVCVYETAYPTGVTQLTMIAHASSAKGFFAWLSEDGHLLTMEIVTGASTWVTIKNPLFLARYRYIKGEG